MVLLGMFCCFRGREIFGGFSSVLRLIVRLFYRLELCWRSYFAKIIQKQPNQYIYGFTKIQSILINIIILAITEFTCEKCQKYAQDMPEWVRNNVRSSIRKSKDRKLKNQKMAKSLIKGNSVPDVIIRHLNEIQSISQAVSELYLKCQKLKQHQPEPTEPLFAITASDHNEQRSKIIRDLINTVKNAKIDYRYYQRVICQQRYEKLVGNTLEIINAACRSPNHEFFKSRKVQIQVIRLVVTAFDEIQRKIGKYFQELRIQYPIQLTECMKGTIKLVQQIKVEKSNKKNEDYKIIFKFQSEPGKNTDGKSQLKTDSRPETSKFSHVFTTATTRPSSTGKSNRQGLKMLRVPDFRNSTSINQNEPRLDQRKSQIVQKAPLMKMKKMQRCKTAKILRTNKVEQKNLYHQTPIQQKNIQENIIEVHEDARSTPFRNTNQSNFQRNTTSRNDQKVQSLNSSQGIRETSKPIRFTDEVSRDKKKKKSRAARIQNSNLWARLNPLKSSDGFQKSLFNKKNPKMSETIIFKDSSKVGLPKRNYQSHQNLIYAQQKSSGPTNFAKSNSYKKKTRTNRRNRTIKGLQASEIPEEAPYQDQKPILLLIKPPPSEPVKQETSISHLPAPETERKQKMLRHEITSMMKIKDLKKSLKKVDVSNLSENSIQNVESNSLKISLEEINNIRSTFLKARWQNKIIGSQNQENSVFFIEQGFLSQRENTRFQAHLMKMKESYGRQYHQEPFSIQQEIEEINNEKLKELQRQDTFQMENEWIIGKYRRPQNEQGFEQAGLDKYCVI